MTNTLSASDKKRSNSLRVRFNISSKELGMESVYEALNSLPDDAARTQQVRRWLFEAQDSFLSLCTKQPNHGNKLLSMQPMAVDTTNSSSISPAISQPAPPARRRTALDALARMGLTVTSNLIP